MSILYTALSVTGILVVGFVRVFRRHSAYKEQINFAIEYLQQYRKLVQQWHNGKFDGESYGWLTYHSVKIQSQIGMFGVVDYRPPFANHIVRNYQMILNTLPDIRSGKVHRDDVASVEDMLLRYIGWREEIIKAYARQLYNPVSWLREGVQFVIVLPFLVLEWLGIIGKETTDRFDNSGFIRFISGLVTLIGLLGTIIGITVDFDRFNEIINPLINR